MWTIQRALVTHLTQFNEVIRASKSHWRQPPEYLSAALPLLAVEELLVVPEPPAEEFYRRLGSGTPAGV